MTCLLYHRDIVVTSLLDWVISVHGHGPCERVLVLTAGRLISVPGHGPCERVLILTAGRLISVPGPGSC